MDDPVGTLADDAEHGAAWLSLFALDALEAAAETAETYEEVAELARELRTARPSMYAVANRVNGAMVGAAERTPAAVAESARAVRERAVDADETAADNAADRIDGATVLTLSRSGTVATALDRAVTDGVVVLESLPGGEGTSVAESLSTDHDVTLARDAAVADRVAAGVGAVLVGADAVLPDGSVVNKVGTRTAATVAAHEGASVFVACASAKVAPAGTTDVDRERRPRAGLYDGDAPVAVHEPTFDRTPAALVDAVVTERGALDAEGVHAVAAAHAAAAEWAE
jgi:translation initiation factor 2B subunit (eIF-2B alpha/beta/delta family)